MKGYVVGVCVLLLNVPELLLWEFLFDSLTVNERRLNTYKQNPSCVKSGNFITNKHEDRTS